MEDFINQYYIIINYSNIKKRIGIINFFYLIYQ